MRKSAARADTCVRFHDSFMIFLPMMMLRVSSIALLRREHEWVRSVATGGASIEHSSTRSAGFKDIPPALGLPTATRPGAPVASIAPLIAM